MKFIISHDIDHFYWSDHFFKDLFIQKYIVKNFYYLTRRKISFDLFRVRMGLFSSNRISRLTELTEFNVRNKVPATYFCGVRNALNLSYSLQTATQIRNYINQAGFPLYIHGISFEHQKEMEQEKQRFVNLIGDKEFMGIRMHYLRNSAKTLAALSQLRYDFDSTIYDLKDPYFIDGMIEFPVSLMEVYLMSYLENDLERVKRETLSQIERATQKKLKYFTVIFHDHHFSEGFPLHKAWYEWFIGFLRDKDLPMINFEQASIELKKLNQ
jgi:hypothetical protein